MKAVLMASVIALVLGAGGGYGFYVTVSGAGSPEPVTAAAASKTPDNAKTASKSGDRKEAPSHAGVAISVSAKDELMAMEPLVTSIGGGSKAWCRLELWAVVNSAQKKDAPAILKALSDRLVPFIQTMTVADFETATALDFLRDDLSEIARTSTKGLVRELIIKGFIIE